MTTLQIELWQLLTFLIGLLIAFLGAAFGAGKILVAQMDKRLDERFKAQDAARETGSAALRDTLNKHLAQEEKTSAQLQALEKDFLHFQAALPLNYVRREDYVRNQTVIEAKLDALALKLENAQLKGALKS